MCLYVSPMQVNALSSDGRCKAFGAEADGYGRGEGYTAVVLEPVQSVHSRDGSHPAAIVAGSAVNQDGRSSSLTAPHGPSQQVYMSGVQGVRRGCVA
jgi:acyl transferase domain-containing protein